LSDADQRVHGGIAALELERLGIARDRVLDLSVNVNPLGPHPRVLQAVQRASLESYPDPHATLACQAIAHSQDIDPARVLVGHGSAELLWTVVSTLAGGQRPLLVTAPTFSEPQLAARAWRVPLVTLRTSESEAFVIDRAALDRAIGEHDPGAVYLCQPNNPDGGALPALELRALCEAHPRTLFVVDQAFLSLSSRHAEQAMRFGDNVVLVRSLTKDHALPGLRVGYALASPERVRELAARRPSWMVSAPAEAAIVAACEQPEHVRQARELWLSATAALAEGCAALGLSVVPSLTPFFLVRVGDADDLRQRLLSRHAIVVRSARSFGLPHHVRMAGCALPERARVLAALRAELRA
jgi:histidinol-phosphate/aromatic aminotransferase/cobyric acid decarboxylase-like protein